MNIVDELLEHGVVSATDVLVKQLNEKVEKIFRATTLNWGWSSSQTQEHVRELAQLAVKTILETKL